MSVSAIGALWRVMLPQTRRMVCLAALLGGPGGTAEAHRLDETLQTALIDIQTNSIRIELSLTPGVSSFGAVRSLVDVNRDGQFSASEIEAYADLIRSQLSLQLDGKRLELGNASWEMPDLTELQDGAGIMRLEMRATFPAMEGGSHEIRFENHHLPASSAYLVNALQPGTSAIGVLGQTRNEVQSQSRIQVIVRRLAR